jgi:hypothetical protein
VLVNDPGKDGTFFTQSETSNIAFGNTIVVGFNDSESFNGFGGPNSQFTGFSLSTDGGQTFADLGALPPNSNGDLGDPVLARDNTSGTIYFSTLAFGSFFGNPVVQVFRSFDGGQTFQPPVNAATGITPGDFPDKDWLTVDNFPGAGQGNVYATFTDFGFGSARITLTRSTDGGNTFGPSGGVTIATGVVQGSFVAVDPSHNVYVFWLDGNGAAERLMVRKSTDGGQTFGTPVTVATLNTTGVNGDLGLGGFRSNAFPHVVINPVNGDIYVAFNDTPGGGDRSNIYFTQSTDGGMTFSPAIQINDDVGTNDQWQPVIAVKPNGSELFIGWYDRRLDANNNLIDVFGAVGSINTSAHTVTFNDPNFRITDQSFAPVFGTDPAVNPSYMGDYDTASADNTNFYITWGDNRLGTAPDVRFARIDTGLFVSASTPANGDFVSSPPTSYVIHLNDPYDPVTVKNSALTVNGIAATSVALTDPTTLTFSFTVNPVTAQGPQTMAMAADAIERAGDHEPLHAFNATFYFDTLRLAVVSTSPAAGAIFNIPSNLILHFNEAVKASSINPGNLILSSGTVTAASVVSGDPTSVDYSISGPAADGSAMTVTLPQGAILDSDGNPGLGFSANFTANVLISPYPTPLTSVPPSGGLIYDPQVSATIGFVGDTDSFTISLDPNQTASVVVTSAPGLQASAALIAPDGHTVLGTATAASAGATVVLQTIPITKPGTYTIAISGANSTTGAFTAQLFLNAALQNESNGGTPGSDDTLAGAQDLSSSFISLGHGASRGGVVGKVPGGLIPGDVFINLRPFSFGGQNGVALYDNNGNLLNTFNNSALQGGVISGVELGPDSTLYVGLDTSNNGFGGGGNGGELVHLDLNGNLLGVIHLPNDPQGFGFFYPFGFEVAPDGTFWVPQPNSGNIIHTDSSGNLLRSYSLGFGDPEDAAVRADGQVFIVNTNFSEVQQLDPVSGNVSVFAFVNVPIGVAFASSGGNGDLVVTDFFSGVDYFNSSGGIDKFIPSFLANKGEPDTNGNTFVVSAPFADLRKFDVNGNQLFDVQTQGGFPTHLAVIGVDAPSPPPPDTVDYYKFTLAQGQSATLALSSLSGGQADMQLQDASGTPLALAHVTSGSGEAINNFVAPTAGTYYVRVTGNGVKYSLIVTKGADFDTGTASSLAQAQSLQGGLNALGFAGVSSALNKPGGAKVLYFVDFTTNDTFAQAFSALGITPTVATSYPDFENKLASGSWDLVVLMDQDFFVTSWEVPMIKYVNQGGHAIVATWTHPGDVATAFGASWTFQDDQSPITQVSDPIWNGVSNPFQLSNPTYFTWSTGMKATTGQSLGTFPNGDSGLVIGNSRHTILNGFLEDTPANPAQGVLLAENEITALLTAMDTDYYSISAKVANVLTISTSTPADGPGQFVNTFDPKINLYNSAGVLVASDDNSAPDGRNAQLTFKVPSGGAGTYYVQVLASPLTATPTHGEYVLSIQGATGPLPPFVITATNPPAGSHVRALSSITVTFSDAVYLPSLAASDLIVNGVPATGFTVLDDRDVAWTLPPLPGGDNVPELIQITSNLIKNIHGTFNKTSTSSETIFLDTLAPLVTKTSIEEGKVLPGGNLTYTVTFSEAMNTATVTPASFDLHGNFRNVDYAPASFSFDSKSMTLTINYSNLPDDTYTLTLFSTRAKDGGPVTNPNGFQDLVNFGLDGEPHTPRPPSVPSGEGVEGGNFFVDFILDTETAIPVPVPLQPVNPLGSLVYQGATTGVLAPGGDTDTFSVNLNAGQTLTLDLVPGSSFQPIVTVLDPNNHQIGTVTGSAAGAEALLQTLPIAKSGVYEIIVQGNNQTFGLYNLQLFLNAALENEEHGGSRNDSIATAQDLSASFLNLGNGVSRGAVLGSLPVGTSNGDVFFAERSGDVVHVDSSGNVISRIRVPEFDRGVLSGVQEGLNNDIYVGEDLSFGGGVGELVHLDFAGHLLGTIPLPNDLPFGFFYPFGFDVASDGSFWVPQPNASQILHLDPTGKTLASYFFFPGDPEDVALRADGQVFVASGFGNVWQLDPTTGNVGFFASVSFPEGLNFTPSGDLWVSNFFQGILRFNSAGTLEQTISNFSGVVDPQVDPSSNLWATLFFDGVQKYDPSGNPLVNVSAGGPIGLAVIGSDGPAPPPALQPDPADYLSFQLNAGQSATVAIQSLNAGHTSLELDDASGTPLARGATSATNLDQIIANFVARVSGTYYVKVTGTAGVNYNLVVTKGLIFDAEGNNSQSQAQDITATQASGGGALGTIFAPSVAQVGQNFEGLGFNDTSCNCLPPDGALAVGNGFVMEGVNTALRVTDMAGKNLLSEEFSTFFNGVGGTHFLSDPYIVYDDIANRWYVTILDVDFSFQFSDILFAVSNDANPLDGFSLQKRIHVGSTDFLDFEKMGFNNDAVVITANDFFQGSFVQSLAGVSISKSDLLSGKFTDFLWQRDSSHFRAEVPAWMHGAAAGAPMFLVEEAGFGNGSAARVVTMTNILSTSPTFTDNNITVNPYTFPGAADQPGAPFSVATNDTTFTRADWRNGKLVSAQNIAGVNASANVRWYEFDTTTATPSLVQQGTISPGPGISTYFGSAAINANGDIGLTYMESSSMEFVSMYVAGRKAGDALGTLEPGVLVAAGTGDGFFPRAGDYSGIAVDPANGTTFWAENEYQGNALWNTRVASFSLVVPGDEDWYSVNAKVGDKLTISINLPVAGPGQFVDNLSPLVDLYDPQGNLVASGTASFTYTTLKTGSYAVRVLSANGTQGEYVLHVSGATGPLPPMLVTKFNPPAGVLIQPPTSITVDFNHSIYLPSLKASDLTVTDITDPAQGSFTASSFTIVNDHEVIWTLSSSFNGDREDNRVTVSGVQDISGATLSTTTEDYTTDNVPPSVIASSISEGQVLPTGSLTYVVTFSEPMNTSLVTASSFDLHGNFRNVDYAPASFSFDATGTILTINYANLPDDGYTLTLLSTGFQDLVGFDLSPGNFVVDFSLNFGTGPFPVPLTPVKPLGSLIYQGSITNVYSYLGDTDSYTLSVDPNQTISVVITAPHVQATVILKDPNGNIISTKSASSIGQNLLIQAVPTDTSTTGTYTIIVGGVGSAFGLETAQVTLNAAMQNESFGLGSDDTIPTAQDLSGAFVSLGTAGSRAAVLGKVPGGLTTGDVFFNERTDQFGSPGGKVALYDNNGNLIKLITNPALQAGIISGVQLGPDNTLYVGVDTSNGGFGGGGFGGELVHFDANGNLLGIIALPNEAFSFGFYYPFGFDVAADGTIWVPQPTPGVIIQVDGSGNLLRSYFVGGNPEDVAVRADGQVFIADGFQILQLDPATGNVTTFAFVNFSLGVAFAGPGGTGDLAVADFFNGIDYFNSSGGLDKFIPAFLANKGQPDPNGNTFVVSFASVDLRKFDPNGNPLFDNFLAGPPTHLAVVGSDAPAPPPPDTNDYYSFSLTMGQSVTIALTDLGGGQANIDLEDSKGNVLATGTAVSTNVNQLIQNFVAGTPATYYVHVTGSGVSYSLVVTKSADFDVEANNDPAHAQNLNGTTGVLGTIFAPSVPQVGQNFEGLGFNDTSCNCLPPDGALAVGNGFVMEGVNTALRITDMAGNNLLSEEFSTFFNGVGGTSFLSDPYIVYDDIANRWYVTILDFSSFQFSDILFAVSNDANPLDGFKLQERIHVGSTDFLDFEKMGFNNDAVVITANDFFQGSFVQSLAGVSISKSDLLSGKFTDFLWQRDSSHFRAEVPAWMHGAAAGAPMYLVEEAGFGNGSAARVVTMTNILSTSPTFTDTDIPVDPYGFPPPANQPGNPNSVATNDATFTRADWRNGKLVSAQNVGLPSDGFAEAHVRWYEFDTTTATPSLVQQGTISPGPGISTYFGSAAINVNGDIGLTYMESSSTEFVSMYVTGRKSSDAPGTLASGVLVAAGTGDGFFPRAGDYSGIAVDPADGTTFWAENEYQGNALWNTRVASFTVVPPADVDTYSFTLAAGATLNLATSTPAGGPGEFVNLLVPHIVLLDSNGNIVATGTDGSDGRNETISYTSAAGGTYFIEVSGENGTQGEYYLDAIDPPGTISHSSVPGAMGTALVSFSTEPALDPESMPAGMLGADFRSAAIQAGPEGLLNPPPTLATASVSNTGELWDRLNLPCIHEEPLENALGQFGKALVRDVTPKAHNLGSLWNTETILSRVAVDDGDDWIASMVTMRGAAK